MLCGVSADLLVSLQKDTLSPKFNLNLEDIRQAMIYQTAISCSSPPVRVDNARHTKERIRAVCVSFVFGRQNELKNVFLVQRMVGLIV